MLRCMIGTARQAGGKTAHYTALAARDEQQLPSRQSGGIRLSMNIGPFELLGVLFAIAVIVGGIFLLKALLGDRKS
jgi:hypothetical protein